MVPTLTRGLVALQQGWYRVGSESGWPPLGRAGTPQTLLKTVATSRAGTIFITAGITAVVTTVFWLVVGVIAYRFVTDDQPPFVVSVTSPGAAEVGDRFDLVVSVSNPTDDDLDLDSIDFYDSLTDGFKIVAIDPTPNSRDSIMDFLTLNYSRTLGPGDTFECRLQLEAVENGVWTGDIDSCTPSQKFVTSSHTIVITDSQVDPANPDAAGTGEP